jgi:hypothetical protein
MLSGRRPFRTTVDMRPQPGGARSQHYATAAREAGQPSIEVVRANCKSVLTAVMRQPCASAFGDDRRRRSLAFAYRSFAGTGG